MAPGEDSARGARVQDNTAPGPRIIAIDAARGAALIGMAIYHLSWDFAYFHLAPADLPINPPMRLFSHMVAGDVSVAGGRVAGARPSRAACAGAAFWRRLAIVGGAAAPRQRGDLSLLRRTRSILFGILHCIAAASLLAAPLIALPAWVALILSALVLAAPWLLASPRSIRRRSSGSALGRSRRRRSIGARSRHGRAFVFLGLALTRLNARRLLASPLARWRPAPGDWRVFGWARLGGAA